MGARILVLLWALILALGLAARAGAQTVQQPQVLVRSDGATFLLYDGTRHAVTAVDMGAEALAAIPESEMVFTAPPEPQALLKTEDGTFFLVRGGARAALEVLDLSDAEIDALPEGAPVVADLVGAGAVSVGQQPPSAVTPTPTPGPQWEYRAEGRCEPNEGTTWIEGRVFNRNGTPRDGLAIHVWADQWPGVWTTGGRYEVILGGGGPRAGTWYVALFDSKDGKQLSEAVQFVTNTYPVRMSQGPGGCQHMYVDFYKLTGPLLGKISGKVFFDLDANGKMDGNDFPVSTAGIKVMASDGGWWTRTTSRDDGTWEVCCLTEGTFVVFLEVGPEWKLTTPGVIGGITIDGSGATVGGNDFGIWRVMPGR